MPNPSAKELHGSNSPGASRRRKNQWRYYMPIIELVKFIFGNAKHPALDLSSGAIVV
jgi:hypothetical protein